MHDEQKRRKERRTRIEIIIAYIVVALLYMLNSCCQAAEHQVWCAQKIEGSLIQCDEWERLRFKAEQEEKFDSHRLIAAETLVMFGCEVNRHFSFYLGNRWANERPDGKGRLRAEWRPTLDVCLNAPEFWTLKFDFRSRFEWRDKHGDKAYMRYRERLRLRTTWSMTDFKVSPFASEEAFFSDKPGAAKEDFLDRNRLQVGLSFNPIMSHRNLSCSLYYMIQHDIQRGGHRDGTRQVYADSKSHTASIQVQPTPPMRNP